VYGSVLKGGKVRWRQGDRYRSQTFDRKGDAVTLAAEIRRRQQLGTLALLDCGRITLAQYVIRIWADRLAAGHGRTQEVGVRAPLAPSTALVDNQGDTSIDALGRPAQVWPAQWLPVDFAANAARAGARVVRETIDKLRSAQADSVEADGPVVICVEVDRDEGVPDFNGWWEVPVAEASEDRHVQKADAEYERG
jgi:hypothetical protein